MIQRLWASYRARRRFFRCLIDSGVLRSGDHTVRYGLSEGQMDRMFPTRKLRRRISYTPQGDR